MELRQEKGAQGNADANSQSGEQIEYQAVGALRAKMSLEATDHQAKQGSHQTIRHGTAEKQGAASCGQRAAQIDQQWLGGFCRDLGNFPAQLIQRNRIGAAPAAQIVQRFQNGEIRAAGSQDPAGLGDVPPAGQRHSHHDAGGDDKGVHPHCPVSCAHAGQSVLYPVYLCPYSQKRFRNVHETVQQDLRLRRDRDLICVHVT